MSTSIENYSFGHPLESQLFLTPHSGAVTVPSPPVTPAISTPSLTVPLPTIGAPIPVPNVSASPLKPPTINLPGLTAPPPPPVAATKKTKSRRSRRRHSDSESGGSSDEEDLTDKDKIKHENYQRMIYQYIWGDHFGPDLQARGFKHTREQIDKLSLREAKKLHKKIYLTVCNIGGEALLGTGITLLAGGIEKLATSSKAFSEKADLTGFQAQLSQCKPFLNAVAQLQIENSDVSALGPLPRMAILGAQVAFSCMATNGIAKWAAKLKVQTPDGQVSGLQALQSISAGQAPQRTVNGATTGEIYDRVAKTLADEIEVQVVNQPVQTSTQGQVAAAVQAIEARTAQTSESSATSSTPAPTASTNPRKPKSRILEG